MAVTTNVAKGLPENELWQPTKLVNRWCSTYDPDSGTARASPIPDGVHEDTAAFSFRGSRFVRTGYGIVFWDYLVQPNGDIVGVV